MKRPLLATVGLHTRSVVHVQAVRSYSLLAHGARQVMQGVHTRLVVLVQAVDSRSLLEHALRHAVQLVSWLVAVLYVPDGQLEQLPLLTPVPLLHVCSVPDPGLAAQLVCEQLDDVPPTHASEPQKLL